MQETTTTCISFRHTVSHATQTTMEIMPARDTQHQIFRVRDAHLTTMVPTLNIVRTVDTHYHETQARDRERTQS